MQNEFSFPDEFNGYSRIEYLSVFISFLYALVISEFFLGWSKMLRNRSQLKFSADHLAYTIIFFWILMINWYFLWGRMAFLNTGFFYFILIVIPIALCYFASVLFFPDLDKVSDLQLHFDKNFKIIGINLSAFILVNMLIGFWLKEETLSLPTAIKSLNSILIFTTSYFDLKKLRRPVAIIVVIGLLAGSIKFAFV